MLAFNLAAAAFGPFSAATGFSAATRRHSAVQACKGSQHDSISYRRHVLLGSEAPTELPTTSIEDTDISLPLIQMPLSELMLPGETRVLSLIERLINQSINRLFSCSAGPQE